MAHSEVLAARVRRALAGHPGLAEKRMFGGLCFLLRGNMCCGVVGDELMVRVGPEEHRAALALPHAREMDFTGRPLRGFVYVSPAGIAADAELAAWVERGARFAESLPAKG
ncbi:MAG TPA: TfoX/Sxy family protein [Thermoanaerobaculia bacterium]